MKKNLQFIFKSFFQFIFKLIYGKIVYLDNNLIHENIKIDKINSKELIDSNNDNYNLYTISEGRLYTDYVENVAVINNNNILDKISFQQKDSKLIDTKFNICLKNGTPRIKKKVQGNILSLVQGASGNKNYFHWLFDILPRIKIFSEFHALKNIDYFYLPELAQFQKDSLKFLGLDNIKILNANRYRHIQAKKLFITDHPWYKEGYILEAVNNMPSWIIHWLRNSFIDKSEKFECNEKIFIDRTESIYNHCQIQNNNEVLNFLNKKGFTSYQVGQLPFAQQIHLFKNAKIIVGAHGAAFANLIFCQKNTKVIDIKPIEHANYVDKKISKLNNLDFHFIETQTLKDESKNKGDIFLKIEDLKNKL